MLALDADDHLTSPLVPEQACAARRQETSVLKFQIKLKDRKSLREVTYTI
jgi:hypothetical protein